MAGLKKGKKDGSSPNMVLVIFLILFVLTSIGLGVFAYYGYEGQEGLKQKAKAAEATAKGIKDGRDQDTLAQYIGRLALGVGDLSPDDKTQFNVLWGNFISSPDKFPELGPVIKAMHDQNTGDLKGFNEAEVRYETTYRTEIKKAVDDAKKSKAMLDATQKEFNDFKGNYDVLLAKYEKDVKDMLDRIAKGNQDALAQALKTNLQFPAIQDALVKREADIKKKDEEHIKELEDRDGRIARLNQSIADLEKKLNDRNLGVAVAPQGGGGDLHALMLDVSRGIPLWDKALGKIIRVDPTNLSVYIDIGSKSGIKADTSFNVFTNGPGGKADRQLKGTIEVTRVMNETTSVARITSLYDDKGESIPLTTEGTRARAISEADNIMREGDLLFNMFFDMHVFIAGNVNFSGYNSDSPAGQNLQVHEFMNQLRKQNVVIDGYINLLNGQVEGTITPRTRLLIRGDITQLNRTEEESNRYRQMVEAYQILKKQAVDQGMFIISAENFAAVAGIRPPAQTNRDGANFRSSLPWTGGAAVQRFDRVVEGAVGVGAAPPNAIPMPEMKKE